MGSWSHEHHKNWKAHVPKPKFSRNVLNRLKLKVKETQHHSVDCFPEILKNHRGESYWPPVGNRVKSVLKQIDLVSFFFPLYGSLKQSDVVYIIWTLKPTNDLRPAHEMAFLVLAAGFTFASHLSNRTTYDLKEQFSNLSPWYMHWQTVHFLQLRLAFVLSDECEQKK